MRALNSRLQNAHPVVLFLFLTVFWGVGTWALGFLTGSSSFSVRSVITRGVAAIVFGLVMTGFIVWRRRKSGGVQTASAINQAVKTGVLPADANAETWVRLLRARERSLSISRWVSPVFFSLFAALGVYLIVSSARATALGWVCTVVFIGFAVFSVVVANRQLPKIRSLITQLTQRQTSPPPISPSDTA